MLTRGNGNRRDVRWSRVLSAHLPVVLHWHSALRALPFSFRVATTELSSWSVVLGSLKQEGLSPGAEEVPVAALQLPKAYNHYSQGSDLALLQLSHPTVHTTLCLPRSTYHFPFGASCWATGWDQNTSNGKSCPVESLEGTLPAPAPLLPRARLSFISVASFQDPTEPAPSSHQPPHLQLSL